ncbi:MAG TPA: DUF4199 domain-containing protein [Gemmatimonadaceae bacterium]|jgi:hypothetical protein
MKKIVWTFGLISGAIMALFMIATLPFVNALGDHSYLVGYTGIVAGFLLVYFGVRSYRDNVLGGTIGFGRAFTVGLLIAAISSVCYVATWEILYYKFMPDFYSRYAQSAVDQVRKGGASAAEIAKTQATMEAMVKSAESPVWVAAMTFVEPFPVGFVIALVSAGMLRRKRGSRDPVLATV